MKNEKPLGRKAYGSIPHLPGSRRGPGDHGIEGGSARIATEKPRNKWDRVIVTEKLDGSCCAVAKVNGEIVALGRAGYLASTSPYEQHHLFAEFVEKKKHTFDRLLEEGERVVGEWMAQAHGTRYDLRVDYPFFMFDIMRGPKRALHEEVASRCWDVHAAMPKVLHNGPPLSIDDAMDLLGEFGHHGATDPVEGAVWRVEGKKRPDAPVKLDFLCKYVRPDKVDGCYLPEETGGEIVWNWERYYPDESVKRCPHCTGRLEEGA